MSDFKETFFLVTDKDGRPTMVRASSIVTAQSLTNDMSVPGTEFLLDAPVAVAMAATTVYKASYPNSSKAEKAEKEGVLFRAQESLQGIFQECIYQTSNDGYRIYRAKALPPPPPPPAPTPVAVPQAPKSTFNP